MNFVFRILRICRTILFHDINASTRRNGNVSRSSVIDGNAELLVEVYSNNTFCDSRTRRLLIFLACFVALASLSGEGVDLLVDSFTPTFQHSGREQVL